MTEKFYRQRLVAHGISLLPPDMELADRIDRIVYDELTIGKVSRESERYMKSELTDIAKENVQAAILACTELEMIVDVKANVLPIYDGTSIHARRSEEHTSELQSLMRISYAVFCLKKKTTTAHTT